jgi:PAS domain S-box-containing protein
MIDEILADKAVTESFLRAVMEHSFDSILVTDNSEESKIIYANKEFSKLTGYSLSDVQGQTPRILQGVGTDESVINRLVDSLKERKTFEGKAINYKKDGTPFLMHWRVVPVGIEGGTEVWIAIQRETDTV